MNFGHLKFSFMGRRASRGKNCHEVKADIDMIFSILEKLVESYEFLDKEIDDKLAQITRQIKELKEGLNGQS